MHSAVSFRTIPRTIHFGFRSWVKSRVSDRIKDDEEFCIVSWLLYLSTLVLTSYSLSPRLGTFLIRFQVALQIHLP